jgi:predicted DNA-binding protein
MRQKGISCVLPEEIYKKLDEESVKSHLTKSTIIRKAIIERLKKEDENISK